jgi:hypothetical protein
MSAGVVSEQSEDEALLGRLYARNKALSLSIGATLTFGQQPQGARREVEAHLAECERAAGRRSGELGEQFEACRDAAAALAALVEETERGSSPPSAERLGAVRASHRRLRRLVWEVFDCEYVPCGHERSH